MKNIVAERIQARLDALNKNPSSVALEASLGRSSVRDILSGRVSSSRLETLRRLTGPLQCTLDYLTGDSDEPDEDGVYRRNVELDVSANVIPNAAEAGVFRPTMTSADKKQYLADRFSDRPFHMTRDYRIPSWSTSLFVMLDASLEDLHIDKGDILTVATHPMDLQIPLTGGSLVAVRHSLQRPELEEISVRKVEINTDAISLSCRINGRRHALSIPNRSIDNESMLLANFYPLENGASIEILGLVVKVEREVSLSDTLDDLSFSPLDE